VTGRPFSFLRGSPSRDLFAPNVVKKFHVAFVTAWMGSAKRWFVRGDSFLVGRFGLLFWLAGVVLALAFSFRPTTAPLFDDEVYWLGSSYYYHLAFVEGDRTTPDWKLLPARENPPFAKYLIGAGLHAFGEQVGTLDLLGAFYLYFAKMVPSSWGGPADQAKRWQVVSRMSLEARSEVEQSGTVPVPFSMLLSGRVVMGVCVGCASLVLFLLARSLFGGVVALIMATYLPLHPITMEAANHVLADAPALALSSLGAAALALSLQSIFSNGDRKSLIIILGLVAGTMAALACASKMNALIVPALALLCYGIIFGRRLVMGSGPPLGLIFSAPLLYLVGFVSVFVALNPTLHVDTLNGMRDLFLEHRRTGEIQAGFLSGRLDGLLERFGALGSLIGFTPWVSLPALVMAGMLLGFGDDRHRFAACWWLLAWLAVGSWIPFARLRYAAPVLLPSLLLIAAGVHWFLSRVSIDSVRRCGGSRVTAPDARAPSPARRASSPPPVA
jgi:hypothetical protein